MTCARPSTSTSRASCPWSGPATSPSSATPTFAPTHPALQWRRPWRCRGWVSVRRPLMTESGEVGSDYRGEWRPRQQSLNLVSTKGHENRMEDSSTNGDEEANGLERSKEAAQKAVCIARSVPLCIWSNSSCCTCSKQVIVDTERI